MTRLLHTTNSYGEAFMQVTPETFHKWASWIPETVKDGEGKEHPLWIVCAPFCAMEYISDEFDQSGDVAQEPERVRQVQKNNVEFYQTQLTESASYLTSFHAPSICSKQNVDYGRIFMCTMVAHKTSLVDDMRKSGLFSSCVLCYKLGA